MHDRSIARVTAKKAAVSYLAFSWPFAYTTVHTYGTAKMAHFEVRFMRERGRLLSREAYNSRQPKVGELHVYQLFEPARSRMFRIAEVGERTWTPDGPVKPKLYDVVLVGWLGNAFTLTGFERVGDVEYAQTWLCELTTK